MRVKPSPRRKRAKGGKTESSSLLVGPLFDFSLLFLVALSSHESFSLSLSLSLSPSLCLSVSLCVCVRSASLDESPALTFNSIFVGYHCSVSNFNPHISHPHSLTPISIQLRLCSEFFLSFSASSNSPFPGLSLKIKLRIEFIFTRINVSHRRIGGNNLHVINAHGQSGAQAERKRPKESFSLLFIAKRFDFRSPYFHSIRVSQRGTPRLCLGVKYF